MNIARRILTVGTGIVAAVGLTVLVPGTGYAETRAPSVAEGGCMGFVCGGVTASPYTSLCVTYALDYAPITRTGVVCAGQHAGGNGSGVDVDGFFIPQYCYGVISGWNSSRANPGWNKISTNQQVTVNIQCP